MSPPDGNTRVTLGWPDKDLNPNSRVHWTTKAKATKAARNEAGWAVRRQFHTKPGWTRAAVALEFCPPDERRRDLQNAIGAAKALVDGIADALGIDDSKFECSYAFGPVVKGGCVNVTISQIETGQEQFKRREREIFAGLAAPKREGKVA